MHYLIKDTDFEKILKFLETIKRLFLNYVRNKIGSASYTDPLVLEKGEEIWNSIKPFHHARNWQALKTYTETESKAAL